MLTNRANAGIVVNALALELEHVRHGVANLVARTVAADDYILRHRSLSIMFLRGVAGYAVDDDGISFAVRS